jgi:hypothetical protein
VVVASPRVAIDGVETGGEVAPGQERRSNHVEAVVTPRNNRKMVVPRGPPINDNGFGFHAT